MHDTTKVTLSDGELAMALNKDFILTKRSVIEKASGLFNSLIPAINNIFSDTVSVFEDLPSLAPKITKGENYNGFPYVILDYPASFDKENIFAIRTMFWWGNFISITLHLSGKYKNHLQENIYKNITADFFICTNENQWQHHFEADNYKAYATFSPTEITQFQQKDFIKIALKYELHHWNMMQSILPEGYNKIKMLLLA
jgi:hypothetical protein